MKIVNFIFLFLISTYLFGGNGDQVIDVLAEAITFDGIPNEKAWDQIEPLNLVTQTPVFGQAPSEQTEIRVAYDDQFFYVSGRLYDREPEKIMANSYKRDAMIPNTEWFGIILDSYNDKQNALGFFTNPNGLRLDLNVINDAYGSNPVNTSWNAVWDVATHTTDEGWFVEMRIPFTSIPFQSQDGEVRMGLISWRYIARKNEVDIYPAISNEFGEWSAWKPSLAHEIVLKDVRRKKPLFISPYVIGGISQDSMLPENSNTFITETKPSFDAGLDIKYGITNNLNLDITVNTDFAQVEADDQQVNLTRFSLFFPEKRLFFQERAGIFSFDFGRREELFYSRRIGLDDDGNPIRIYGGTRVVGRIGKLDIGALSMQTEATDSLPSLNHSVIRFKKQFLNDNSDFGAIMTNQTDFKGDYVSNVGIDTRLNLFGRTFFNAKWAQSFKPHLNNKPFTLNSSRVYLSLVNQKRVGFLFGNSLSKSGREFDPSLGFQTREDFWRWGHRLGWGWLPENSWIQTHNLSIRGQLFRNNAENQIESYSGGLAWSFNSKRGTMGEIRLNYRFENLFDTFELSDEIEIPIGQYEFYGLQVQYTSQFSKPLNATYEIELGEFFNGNRYSLSFTPNWAISSSLEISGSLIYNYLVFDNIKDALTVGRLKALYMFSTKTSISSFIQYNSTTKTFLANIRFRYNPVEGNDLFIVFNDNLNTDRYVDDYYLPASNNRNIVLKYTHTFR